jgi:hypothetical protein
VAGAIVGVLVAMIGIQFAPWILSVTSGILGALF